jgi:hypothetical protein
LKTIHEMNLGNMVLRLVEKDKTLIGVIFADGVKKGQIELRRR